MKTALFGLLVATFTGFVGVQSVTTHTEETLPYSDKGHAETTRVSSELCAKDAAWKAQFLCANRFYAHVQQIEDESVTESHDICSTVSRFYTCLDTVLHDQSCEHDAELMGPAEYFPRLLTHKYHNVCAAELELTSQRLRVKVLRAQGSSDASLSADYSICREEKATREFFACGLLFNVIESSDPPKEKMCTLVRAHKLCVEAAMDRGRCPKRIGIWKNLDYLDNELHTASGSKCPTAKKGRVGKTRQHASSQHCLVHQYASTYFTCGAMFLRSTYVNRPDTGEACRRYNDFLKCIEELVVCRQQSSIEMSFKHFTEILTDDYRHSCRGLNKSNTCDKLTLLKNFFSCGLTYCHSYNTFLPSYAQALPQICRILEDFLNCTHEQVLTNTCGYTELFANVRAVRNYIVDSVNEKHHSTCTIPPGMQRRRAAVAARQSSCDEFRAVKRLLLCGVAFHRMLSGSAPSAKGSSSAELTASDNETTAALCLLVKEMKYCMNSAIHDSGCPENAFLSTEISLLKKRLLEEFDSVCDYVPLWTYKNSDRTPNELGCELKEFTEEWEMCDAAEGKKVTDPYWKGPVLHGKGAVSDRQRRRLCSDLLSHQQCMQESATRHHCPDLATSLVDMGGAELLGRIGFLACSSSSPDSQRAALLLLAAGVSHLLARRAAAVC
ncbi:uncharacterized protein [Dermacentor albipictus]|uniref:uncharacterized protein isoform X2 n=1 Tax=Dermacentor albipictus TaxID=60249 RepID=UPI0038FC199D